MKNTIFWLVKFFQDEEYANQFLQGKLFLNRLSYFKKLESQGDDGRADRNEAVAAWLQSQRTSINFLEHPNLNIRPENLARPVSLSFDCHNRYHVFCMTAIHTGDFDCVDGLIDHCEGDEERLSKQLKVHDNCLKLGQFAVVVRASDFVYRAKKAIESASYAFSSDLVEYYNSRSFHGNFRFCEIPFRKSDAFSYQKEYRIIVDTGIIGENSKTIEIGDIRDIAAKMEPKAINQEIRIETRRA